jgi:hypothetical protein
MNENPVGNLAIDEILDSGCEVRQCARKSCQKASGRESHSRLSQAARALAV